MTEQTKTKIPAPLYAAAGAGDLAYEKLRHLPEIVDELRDKAVATTTELRERAQAWSKAANGKAADLQKKAVAELDADHLRELALRNRDAFLAGAQKAEEKAKAVYVQLVARGERVVGSGVEATAEVVNADIEGTKAPAELPASTSTEAFDAAAKTTRPIKRTVKPAIER